MTPRKTVTLCSGERVAALGQGTWRMGEDTATRQQEVATLQLGLDLGLTLIDTAEMYGDGRTERVIAEAIQGRRDEVFLVSKVLPSNATQRGTVSACERSLKRLQTDRIDLYLLHWRGRTELEETIDGFEELRRAGKIRYWGVSNFDVWDMEELLGMPGGPGVATDQVLYNLMRRGVEWDLLPLLRERRLPLMAYSPIGQGKLARNRKLTDFARRHGMTAAQAALAWLLAKGDVIVIPKTACPERLKENIGALDHPLTKTQLGELDRLFPPPTGPTPLQVI